MDLYTIRRELMSGKTIYDLPLRVTYYDRVSTEKLEQKNSLINQDMFFKNKILSNQNWILVEGYTDDGITGTSTRKRNDFKQMIEDGLNDKYDLILTKEVCRFARNTLDTLHITRDLLAKGIGVYFELDNINTLEQEGELRLTIMASLAQDESRRISERVKFGFSRAIERGRVLGNNAIWGYEKNKCKLELNEEEAKIVKRIYEIYATGEVGIRRIGRELAKEGIYTRKGEVFAYSTIKNILTNPKYKGFYSGNKTRVIDFMTKQRVNLGKDEIVEYKTTEDIVPQIVEDKIWQKCHEILKERSERMKTPKLGYNNKYKYSGKIFCKKDGQSYWRSANRGKEFWQCSLYKSKGIKGCSDNVNVYTETLDKIIKEIFDNLFINKDQFLNELIEKCINCMQEGSSNEDTKKIKNKIEELKKEKKKLIKLYTSDLINEKEFQEENEIYNKKIEDLQQEYDTILERRNLNSIEENKKILDMSFRKDIQFNQGMPSQLIDAIVEKIEVEKIDDDGLADLKFTLKIGLTIEILYRRQKIIKYIDMQKIAS